MISNLFLQKQGDGCENKKSLVAKIKWLQLIEEDKKNYMSNL